MSTNTLVTTQLSTSHPSSFSPAGSHNVKLIKGTTNSNTYRDIRQYLMSNGATPLVEKRRLTGQHFVQRACPDRECYGVFATSNITAGKVLGEYTGKCSVFAEFGKFNMYLAIIDDPQAGAVFQVDASTGGNLMGEINHHFDFSGSSPQSQPNTTWQHVVDLETRLPHILVVATREIPEGQELFINYGDAYWVATYKAKADHLEDELAKLKIMYDELQATLNAVEGGQILLEPLAQATEGESEEQEYEQAPTPSGEGDEAEEVM
jgi:hypothetical protein